MESIFERLTSRGPALIGVVGLHVALIAGMAAQRFAAEQLNTTPIFVDFIDAVAEAHKDVPPPPVKIEHTLPTLTAPEAPSMPPSDWVVAAAPVERVATAEVSKPVESMPITEARFDADYLNNPSPTYPSLSRRMREQGVVVLRVRVKQDGQAAEVVVYQHSGHARLDAAALSAVRKWRFVPARRGDASIESWVLVPIEFALNS